MTGPDPPCLRLDDKMMVDSTLTPFSLLDTGSGDLVFRVCGSSRHGQIVRLRSAKCTIGSARQCTLRLRARGVGPVHCLVLRGAGGTVVRRWSPDTRLNGRTFGDARLVPGDRLGIGTIELEVIEAGPLSEQRPAETGQTEFGRPATAQTGPTEQLDARMTGLESQREELKRQHQQWEAERAEAERQLKKQAEEFEARGKELNSRREAFELKGAHHGFSPACRHRRSSPDAHRSLPWRPQGYARPSTGSDSDFGCGFTGRDRGGGGR